MSQYQDYFFSDAQREDEYSMLNSPLMARKRISSFDFLRDHQLEKEDHPTLDYPDITETGPVTQKNNFNLQIDFSKKPKRIKRTIQIDQQKKAKRKQIFKGLKDDTTQLNTNYRTILVKKLKEHLMLRELGPDERTFIQQFCRGIASFAGFKKLFESQTIKQKGLKFVKSPRVIADILNSHSSLPNKMTLLKYIQCLKQNFEFQKIIKWKELDFQ